LNSLFIFYLDLHNEELLLYAFRKVLAWWNHEVQDERSVRHASELEKCTQGVGWQTW